MLLEEHKIDDYNDDSIVCGYCPENLGEEELKTFVPLFTVIQYDIGLLRGQEWESGTGLEWFVWYKVRWSVDLLMIGITGFISLL